MSPPWELTLLLNCSWLSQRGVDGLVRRAGGLGDRRIGCLGLVDQVLGKCEVLVVVRLAGVVDQLLRNSLGLVLSRGRSRFGLLWTVHRRVRLVCWAGSSPLGTAIRRTCSRGGCWGRCWVHFGEALRSGGRRLEG